MTDLEPGWTRRLLTDGEVAELRAIAARARKFPLRLGLMTAMIAAVLVRIFTAARGVSAVLLGVFGAFVVAMAWARWLRARAVAAELEADAAQGWVAQGSGARDGLEVLPRSRAHWTERGAPARWRARGRRTPAGAVSPASARPPAAPGSR